MMDRQHVLRRLQSLVDPARIATDDATLRAYADDYPEIPGHAPEKSIDDTGLADAGLSGHEDDLTQAAPRRVEPRLEPVQNGVPADEVGRAPVADVAGATGIGGWPR